MNLYVIRLAKQELCIKAGSQAGAWEPGQGEGGFSLVPKLYLGTKMVAKLNLAGKCVPKLSLGTRK
jgi:hypothetical protein